MSGLLQGLYGLTPEMEYECIIVIIFTYLVNQIFCQLNFDHNMVGQLSFCISLLLVLLTHNRNCSYIQRKNGARHMTH